MPTNETSSNPIGFTVNPSTGASPPPSSGVDITRQLLNNVGVDLTWNPMVKFTSPSTKNFTSLNVTQGATCSGSICGHDAHDRFMFVWSFGGLGFTVGGDKHQIGHHDYRIGHRGRCRHLHRSGRRRHLQGQYFADRQNDDDHIDQHPFAEPGFLDALATGLPHTPGTTPCPISRMTIPPTSPCGSPVAPASPTASDINMFFVSKLNPPASGGTLYGFSWIGNNGVAIGGNTFFAPTPLQARPDTIAHELLHDLGLDHATYGAGPYNPPSSSNPFPPEGSRSRSLLPLWLESAIRAIWRAAPI